MHEQVSSKYLPAILATILETASHGPRNDLVNLDIVAKDHGILASQFQNARFEIGSTPTHDLPSNRRATCKDNLVDKLAIDQGRSTLSKARQRLHDIGIMTMNFQGRLNDSGKVGCRPCGVLTDLRDYGISTEQTGDDMIEHVVEGIIPRSDDAENAKGHVFYVCSLVQHHGPGGPVGFLQPLLSVDVDAPDFLAGGHDFSEEGVDLRFPRVASAHAADIFLVLDDVFLDGAEYHAALGVGGASPGFLGDGCLCAEGLDGIFVHGWSGAEVLECGGIPALDEVWLRWKAQLGVRHGFGFDSIILGFGRSERYFDRGRRLEEELCEERNKCRGRFADCCKEVGDSDKDGALDETWQIVEGT
jgi:hypothetical protein